MVGENNKLEYLQALAQYRLGTRVKTQIELFRQGLNSLIPEDLLSIFDENELEVYNFLNYRFHMKCKI